MGDLQTLRNKELAGRLARLAGLFVAAAFACLAAGCVEEHDTPKPLPKLTLTSGAFKAGDRLPPQFTCDGIGDSPPLEWSPGPPDTAVYAVTCTDPNAPGGDFNHWAIYNLPVATTHLPEAVTPTQNAPIGSSAAVNDFERMGYGGPCPPTGSTHHYIFRVYALDSRVEITTGAGASNIAALLRSHALAIGELDSVYGR